MTLDEAIKHCEETAEEARRTPCIKGGLVQKCGAEHEELAEWLKELKARRSSAETAGDLAPMKSEDQAQVATSRQAAIYGACIPLNPRTKKNSQRIVTNSKTKAPMILPDAKYREYEREAGWFLKKPETPISQPVNVKCTFYRDSRRRCDLTNLLEAIDDILVKYGILADDNFEIIRGHDGSRVFVDRSRPRTLIEITPLTE